MHRGALAQLRPGRGLNEILQVLPGGRFAVIAGNGKADFSGDGGPAARASLNDPGGIAVARSGTLYFAEMGNNRIRAVSASGTIITVAGTGRWGGWVASGTPARRASLGDPSDVTLGPGGVLPRLRPPSHGHTRGPGKTGCPQATRKTPGAADANKGVEPRAAAGRRPDCGPCRRKGQQMKNMTPRWWLATAAAVATGASGQAAVRPPGDRSARRAIPRLILAAMAGGIGLAAVGGLAAAGPAQAADQPGAAGAVYTMTNSPGGNAIEAYARASDGTLTPAGISPTGGDGGHLGSGHSIAVSRDGSVVVNVNAGSNSISAFAATPRGLRLIGTASSGGTDPNSVTIAGDNLVYVLNAGSDTIAGFRLSDAGLHPIPGSVQPLGAGALVPRQIQFTNDGTVLVVDEGGSNTIDTFVVGPNGQAGPAVTTAAAGGPFGFDFDRAGHLLVSDAALTTGQSGATSYDVASDGTVTANGPAVPIDQAAACWLAAAGGFAYTANAGSGSIGRYAVAPDGTLTALGSTLVANNPASHPLDEGVSADQNYLYVLANGLSQIVGYHVGSDGSLTQVTTAPAAAGSGGIGAN